jgi:hypothetical protein
MPPAKKAAASKSADDKVTESTASEPEVDETEETPTEVAQPADPNQPYTVEDSTGTERIVAPAGDGWEPAPVDPSEEQLAAAEKAEEAAEARKAARLTPLEDRGEGDDAKSSKKS